MDVSVILCTYNRFESLERALQSFKGIAMDSDSWEMIVVDNNSQDQTVTVVKKFQRDFGSNLKYVFEEKQGLSHARNKGIRYSEGEIIAFIDDDVVLDKAWLINIKRAFKEHQVVCVGGKILPLWEVPKPKWLVPALYAKLALLDLGNKPLYLNNPGIWGANFAVRAEMFKKYGGFNTNLGRISEKLFASEETEFLLRLLAGGEHLLYHPDILVYHCISRDRISKNYFRRWTFDVAESNVTLLKSVNYRSRVWSLPDYSIRKLLRYTILFLLGSIIFSKKRFIYELRFIDQCSYLVHKINNKL